MTRPQVVVMAQAGVGLVAELLSLDLKGGTWHGKSQTPEVRIRSGLSTGGRRGMLGNSPVFSEFGQDTEVV
jgi:hypothetical protein